MDDESSNMIVVKAHQIENQTFYGDRDIIKMS